ncbi:hypothetical protein D3C76_1455560 [compost metagenome]
MQQRSGQHDQVQDHHDRVLQETHKTGPGFRAVLQRENTVHQLKAEPHRRNRRAFTQHIEAIKRQFFPPGSRHWPHVGFAFSRHHALLSVVSG